MLAARTPPAVARSGRGGSRASRWPWAARARERAARGRPASTTNSVARLADRTEALILPGAAARTAPGRYRLAFGEPIDVRTLSPSERKVEALTTRVNQRLEEPILARPEQWLWLHDRWRLD